MPWKECRKMDEKLKCVSRFLDGEKIAALCRDFGISRVTGHKIIDRYRESGLAEVTQYIIILMGKTGHSAILTQ